jgi:hypothetical protein
MAIPQPCSLQLVTRPKYTAMTLLVTLLAVSVIARPHGAGQRAMHVSTVGVSGRRLAEQTVRAGIMASRTTSVNCPRTRIQNHSGCEYLVTVSADSTFVVRQAPRTAG